MLVLSFMSELALIVVRARAAAMVPDIPDAVRQTGSEGQSAGTSAPARAADIETTFDSDDESNVRRRAASSNSKKKIRKKTEKKACSAASINDMGMIFKTRDWQFNTDATKNRSDSIGLSKRLCELDLLPDRERFSERVRSAFRDKGMYSAEQMESKGPELDKLVTHIYDAAVDLEATRFDLVAVTALALHYYFFLCEEGEAVEDKHRDSRTRGFLGVHRGSGQRGRTRMHRYDPSRPFIDRKLRQKFSFLSIRIEFKIYMELLKPTTGPVNFWNVLTNLYMNNDVLLMNGDAVNMDLAKSIVFKLQTFKRLARYVETLPISTEFMGRSVRAPES
ncbi:hypothetical protein PAPHI01_2099 [Pancytospora philotis]|nr:hypothetical protein PAPHI01_2099 [Pancytospora philotis]